MSSLVIRFGFACLGAGGASDATRKFPRLLNGKQGQIFPDHEYETRVVLEADVAIRLAGTIILT